jgi:hypothetical protein
MGVQVDTHEDRARRQPSSTDISENSYERMHITRGMTQYMAATEGSLTIHHGRGAMLGCNFCVL